MSKRDTRQVGRDGRRVPPQRRLRTVRYERAAQWARDNPSEWAGKYAKAVGLDIKIAELAQSRIKRLPIPLDDKVIDAQQRLANLFAAADQIPEAPDFVKWVDRRFNSVLVVNST